MNLNVHHQFLMMMNLVMIHFFMVIQAAEILDIFTQTNVRTVGDTEVSLVQHSSEQMLQIVILVHLQHLNLNQNTDIFVGARLSTYKSIINIYASPQVR